MGKGRRNQRNPDYYKVQGGAVEDRDISRAARQALARPERPARKRVNPEANAPNTLIRTALRRGKKKVG